MVLNGPPVTSAVDPLRADALWPSFLAMTALFPRQIELDLLTPLVPAAGAVYSSAPTAAMDKNGNRYVIKGQDDSRIVLAELFGYELAHILQIPVPPFGVGLFPDDPRPAFCSQMLEVRDLLLFLQRGKVTNPDSVAATIALDIWLANTDRNAGNFVGKHDPAHAGRVQAFAIDFEKSQVVRLDQPIVGVSMIKPQSLWPTDALGEALRGKLPLPNATLAAIESLDDAAIEHALTAAVSVVGASCCPHAESVLAVIRSRKRAIKALAREVWQ